MIDNDPTRSIDRAIEVSGFLIRQIEHKDIQYFSHKMRKGQFFLGHERQEERPRLNTSQQTQEFPATKHALVFLR